MAPKPFLIPCPSGKVQFETKIDGLITIVKWELKNSPRRPIRVYECRLCGSLHLTSQLPNEVLVGLNKVEIQGKLGRDPDLRYTPNGDAVCKFSIAVTTKFKDKQGVKKEVVYWANIVAWRNLAEICAKYLVKGQECIIVGHLTSNTWEKDGVKRTTTEIVADEMHFCGPAPAAKSDDEEIPF